MATLTFGNPCYSIVVEKTNRMDGRWGEGNEKIYMVSKTWSVCKYGKVSRSSMNVQYSSHIVSLHLRESVKR